MAKSIDWIRTYARMGETPAPVCPNCRSTHLSERVIADPATRLGYAYVWCETCREGIHISRIAVRPGRAFVAFDSPEATTALLPDLRLVDA